MKKIYDRLFFAGPMSLGDNFVMSGIVNYYADRCEELHLPVLPIFYNTLHTLYQDHPNIIVVPLNPYDEGENQYVKEQGLSRISRPKLIYTKINGIDIHPVWDIQMYAHYEIPFSMRYTNFRLPKFIQGSAELYQYLSQGEPYVLFHRKSNCFPEGAPINLSVFRQASGLEDIKIIEIDESITNNMMQYVDLILNAREIHCVPSSFHALVDSIKTNAQLYFHDIREKTSMVVSADWNDFRWNVVTYEKRI